MVSPLSFTRTNTEKKYINVLCLLRSAPVKKIFEIIDVSKSVDSVLSLLSSRIIFIKYFFRGPNFEIHLFIFQKDTLEHS